MTPKETKFLESLRVRFVVRLVILMFLHLVTYMIVGLVASSYIVKVHLFYTILSFWVFIQACVTFVLLGCHRTRKQLKGKKKVVLEIVECLLIYPQQDFKMLIKSKISHFTYLRYLFPHYVCIAVYNLFCGICVVNILVHNLQ
jgi:hypothetical protein